MTLEEKVAQMLCVWQTEAGDARRRAGPVRRREGRGSLRPRPRPRPGRAAERRGRRPGRARGMAELTNAIQRFFVERVAPGHPGHLPRGVPARPRGEGRRRASRSRSASARRSIPDLVERLYAMTAAEARARGTHQALTPGRGRGARAALGPRRGDLRRGPVPGGAAGRGRRARASRATRPSATRRRVIATLKHFAAHGQPESGTNCAPVERVDAGAARDVSLDVQGRHPGRRRPQRDAVLQRDRRRAVAREPLALEDVLRGEWGFRGFTVSDYFAIRELNETATERDQPLRGARRPSTPPSWRSRAGVDIELPDPDCYPHLVELVREGDDPGVADRRSRARRCCAAKFRLGLFDDPYVDPDEAERDGARCRRTGALALEAARKTITLLKNEGGVLPLDAAARPAHRRHRPERRPRDARRLQRRADARRHGARRASAAACRPASRCSTTRAARSPSAGPGSRTR